MASDSTVETSGTGGISTRNNPEAADPFTPAVQGIHQGMQYAIQQEQLDHNKQVLQMQMEQHKQQSTDKWFDVMTKAAKAKGPYQKTLFSYANRLAPIIGMPPVDENSAAAINSVPDDAAQALSLMYNDRANMTPENIQKLRNGLEDPTQFPTYLKDINDTHAKRENARVAALASTDNMAARNATQLEVSRQANVTKNLNTAATAAGKGVTVMNPETGQPDVSAINESAGNIAGQKAAESSATSGLKNKQAGVVQQGADAKTKTADAAMIRAQKTGANQEQNREMRATQNVLNSPDIKDTQKSYRTGTQLLNLLNQPNPKWVDLQAASFAFDQAITGSSRAAVALGQKVQLNSWQSFFDKINSNVSNEEKGGPDPKEVQIWKDRINGVVSQARQMHSESLAKGYANFSKQLPPDFIAKNTLGAPTLTNAAPATAPAATGKPTFTPGQVQLMLQKGGPATTKTYLKGKGYSDAEISALGVK